MPFFEKIRSQTDSALARAFFVVIVLVFVFWGVGVNSGQRTQVVAEVNGESIYYTDVQKIMRRMQRNESLNEDEVIQLRSDAIEELIKQTALQTYTQDMGIEVSDTEISLQLLEIDAFKGPDGKFNDELYDQILSREAYSKNIFEEQQREGIRIQKLQNLLVDSVIVTDVEVDERFRKTTTSIEVEWVRITEDSVTQYINISDEDIEAFLSSDVTTIEQRYNNDKSRLYDLPERVVYESVRIPKASDAEPSVIETSKGQLAEIKTGIIEGGTMRELANEKGLSYGNPSLPTTANQLPDNIATALFGVENDTTLDVLETDDALVLYRVIEKKPAESKTFDDVKKNIALDILQEQRKSEESQKVAEQLLAAYQQDSRSENIQNMLNKYNLELQNQKDIRLISPEVAGLRDAEELILHLSSVQKVGVLPKVYRSTDGWVVANIVNYSQDNNPEMQDMLKQYIRSQMQNERTSVAVKSYIQEIVNNSNVKRIPLQ